MYYYKNFHFEIFINACRFTIDGQAGRTMRKLFNLNVKAAPLSLVAIGIFLSSSSAVAGTLFDFSGFSSTSGWTASGTSLSSTASPQAGGNVFIGTAPSSSGGYGIESSVVGKNVAVFSYLDNVSIYRDFALTDEMSSLSLNATVLKAGGFWSRTDDYITNSGRVSLQYLSSDGSLLGSSTSDLYTQAGSDLNLSLESDVLDGASTVRVSFTQVDSARFWAGNYGIAYTDASLTYTSASTPTPVPEINGSTIPLLAFILGVIGLGLRSCRSISTDTAAA